jgi:transcriptional regulator with XRE-family HTH domain
VRELREAKGVSQEALENQAGLHRTRISSIEHGQRSVRIETIERLAIALHIQPSELMPKVSLRH